MSIRITRKFAWPTRFPTSVPNGRAFGSVGVIHRLTKELIGAGVNWVDPMCGRCDLCEFRNDIRRARTACKSHLDALEFLKGFSDRCVDGVLYDPPYNDRQGKKYTKLYHSRSDLKYWYDLRKEISRILKIGGKIIMLNWNSNQFPSCEVSEIYLFAHGSERNDTILTIHTKIGLKVPML